MRNVAWLHSLDRAYANQTGDGPIGNFTALEKRLGEKFDETFVQLDDGSRFFARYARGDRTPDETILNRFEGVFRGTREVFDSGPYGSRLWDAISCRDAELARALCDEICHDIRSGVRIEYALKVHGHSGIQDALVPASLARQLDIQEADLKTASAALAQHLTEQPNLVCRLAAVVGALAQYSAGPLIAVEPGVTFSPDERARILPVTAPLLSGLSLELLQARIRGQDDRPLLLVRQREIEVHLVRFGLSLGSVVGLAGMSFYKVEDVVHQRLIPV